MSYWEGTNYQAKREDEGKQLFDPVYKNGETVLHHKGTPHEKEVTYLSEFIYKGERWYNIKLSNGGFMETKFISKIK